MNFRTLRLSLVRQITAAMRTAAETDTDLEPRDRQRLNDAAYGLALALSETMVTPDTVIDLLANGWPDKLDVERPAGARPEGLAIRKLGRLMPYYAALEMRGFRAVVIPIPPEARAAERTRIRLRLRGLSWRLVDIEMADLLRATDRRQARPRAGARQDRRERRGGARETGTVRRRGSAKAGSEAGTRRPAAGERSGPRRPRRHFAFVPPAASLGFRASTGSRPCPRRYRRPARWSGRDWPGATCATPSSTSHSPGNL